MKVACTALVFAAAHLVSGSAWAQEVDEGGWNAYRNERFGFGLRYPANIFSVEKRAEAGDAQLFATKDDEARLLVGAFKNVDKHSVAAYQDYVLRKSYPSYTATYQRRGETWFVVSGHNATKTFYEKVMFTCGGRLINSFAMTYPSDQGSRFDPIVERIEDTFHPSTQCETGAPRAAQQGAKARTAAVSSRAAPKTAPAERAEGRRSALADRIARERGRNVIVILRRTAPPYDRRILRGYVSR